MTEKDPEAMTEEELARFYDERRGDESLWDNSRRIRVRRGSPSTVFSLRLAPEELEVFYQAAQNEGETMSEFIRKAASDRVALIEKRLRRKTKSA